MKNLTMGLLFGLVMGASVQLVADSNQEKFVKAITAGDLDLVKATLTGPGKDALVNFEPIPKLIFY